MSFNWHPVLQSLGLLLTVIAAGLGVTAVFSEGRQHLVSQHAKLGVALGLLVLAQPLNAWFRPPPLPKTPLRQVRATMHMGWWLLVA